MNPNNRLAALALALILVVSPTLTLAAPPAPAAAPATPPSPTSAQVRGVLLDADGLPASAHQIGLKSAQGDLFLSPPTGPDGAFALELIPPGRYRLVAFAPDGAEFPVLGQEVELKPGQVERVELRIAGDAKAPGRDTSQLDETRESTSSRRGGFWQTRTGRIVLIAGGVFATGVLVATLDDDDDDEPATSPSAP